MTRLTPADLPPKVRARLGIDAKGRPAGTRAKSRAGISERAPCPGRCGTCREPFPDFPSWEAHAIARHDGSARWDIDLATPTTPATTPP